MKPKMDCEHVFLPKGESKVEWFTETVVWQCLLTHPSIRMCSGLIGVLKPHHIKPILKITYVRGRYITQKGNCGRTRYT